MDKKFLFHYIKLFSNLENNYSNLENRYSYFENKYSKFENYFVLYIKDYYTIYRGIFLPYSQKSNEKKQQIFPTQERRKRKSIRRNCFLEACLEFFEEALTDADTHLAIHVVALR